MDDEEILATALVAAAAILLLLIVIILCIILSCCGKKHKSSNKEMWSASPKTTHLNAYNYASEGDGAYTTNQNKAHMYKTIKEETTAPEVETTTPEVETTTPEVETTTPEVETTTPEVETTTPEVEETTALEVDSHKEDWPTNNNKYTDSQSYAFPQSEASNHDNLNNNTAHPSQEISHKTFSEEILLGGNIALQSTGEQPNHNIKSHHTNQTNGVWKYHTISRPASETTSHHSLDRHSTASTSSQTTDYYNSPPAQNNKSYYSTFKTHVDITPPQQVNTSNEHTVQASSQYKIINSTIPRPSEKLNNINAVNSSDNIKVFKFSIG